MLDVLPLGTKTYVPVLPLGYVPRERLMLRLAPGRRRRVTLVSAPAGAGKSTLVSALHHEAAGPRAWLTLDGRDNRRGRFVWSLVAALERAGVIGTIDRSSEPDRTVLDAAFERVVGPALVVVDDVHELTAASALRALDHLVQSAPPELALVLVGRADPPVALSKLRARGELTELRLAELSFNLDEAEELFAAQGIVLSADDVAALWRRTEGWVAGLRLAALALEHEPDAHAFVEDATRTQAVVSDYLLHEVLQREPAPVQEFLRRTSVAERVNADLARDLSADPDAGERLASLVQGGVFLAPLDGAGKWYRYHGLMASLLRARLKADSPLAAIALERRAARWFDANGLAAESEPHARRGGDWDLVGRLALRRWVDATLSVGVGDDEDPPRDAPHVPAFALLATARAVARREEPEARKYLREALDSDVGTVDAMFSLACCLVRAEYARVFGADSVPRVIAPLMAHARTGCYRAHEVRAFAELHAADLLLDRDAMADAAEAATRAQRAGLAAGVSWVVADATALLAFCLAADGRAVSASALLPAANDRPGAGGSARPTAAFASAITHLLRDERVAARDDVCRMAESRTAPHAVALAAQVVTAAISHAPLPGAADSEHVHPFALRTVVALGAFDVLGAHAERMLPPSAAALVRARRLLVGNAAEALCAVGSIVDEPSAHVSTRVEANVIAAIAAYELHDDSHALAALAKACELASPESLRLPFALHAARVQDVLERYAPELGAQQGFALDVLDSFRSDEVGTSVEALTERERAVLRYLPMLMSNAEIAAEMFVSINTVKTHLKAVYRKLGVERRRDAVVRAKQLELV